MHFLFHVHGIHGDSLPHSRYIALLGLPSSASTAPSSSCAGLLKMCVRFPLEKCQMHTPWISRHICFTIFVSHMVYYIWNMYLVGRFGVGLTCFSLLYLILLAVFSLSLCLSVYLSPCFSFFWLVALIGGYATIINAMPHTLYVVIVHIWKRHRSGFHSASMCECVVGRQRWRCTLNHTEQILQPTVAYVDYYY